MLIRSPVASSWIAPISERSPTPLAIPASTQRWRYRQRRTSRHPRPLVYSRARKRNVRIFHNQSPVHSFAFASPRLVPASSRPALAFVRTPASVHLTPSLRLVIAAFAPLQPHASIRHDSFHHRRIVRRFRVPGIRFPAVSKRARHLFRHVERNEMK